MITLVLEDDEARYIKYALNQHYDSLLPDSEEQEQCYWSVFILISKELRENNRRKEQNR